MSMFRINVGLGKQPSKLCRLILSKGLSWMIYKHRRDRHIAEYPQAGWRA